MRSRTLALVAATAILSAACSRVAVDPSPTPVVAATVEPPTVKIAFFQDGSIPSANTHSLPAFLGLKLAISQAIDAGDLPVLPELVGFDTGGDPAVAAEMAQEVLDDPAYVAAVAGPFWGGTAPVGDAFEKAGLPTLSLSALGSDHGADWLRLVADQRRQAEALAGYVRGLRGGDGVCLWGDDSPYSVGLGKLLATDLRDDLLATSRFDPGSDPAQASAAAIRDAGCGTVVWTGFATGGALLRGALTQQGSAAIRFVGADALKDDEYLATAAAAADGTVVACPCVDLSASSDERMQRFIHDYQAEYATPPGVYSAEGWDAGGMLLRAFREGATTGAAVLASMRGDAPYAGLANVYTLREDGGLEPSAARIHLYRAESGRWVGLGVGNDSAPPTHTVGVLTVGSCRTGAPYAYADPRGRLVGFDVEFARALARRLDLVLGWTRTSCDAGTAPVDEGRVDVLLTRAAGLPAGTPTSRVYFSTRVAVVMAKNVATRPKPLASLGAGDVVGVVRQGSVPSWARSTLRGSGARLRTFADVQEAYRLLANGRLDAVADTEPSAWAAIEVRPALRVAATADTGDDDVMVAAGPGTDLLAAVDGALGELLDRGTYAMLFAKYFPGATLPENVGTA
jgi:branched-chain amino acid transport system substrate-binding protein